MTIDTWVLIVGAAGVVGRQAAKRLRTRWPEVGILAGGRDLQRAEAIASELGHARGVTIDLDRRDLGLPDDVAVDAVVMFVKDETLNAQLFAGDRGAALIDISSAAFEVGPQTAFHVSGPRSAPVLLASNWLAGVSTFAALDLARAFQRVDRILVSALLDEQDIGGPAAEADFVRQTEAFPSGLVRRNGRFAWLSEGASTGAFEAVDGRRLDARLFGNLDVMSLSAATDAPDVAFQFAVGETSSRRRGASFSHEILIEVEGELPDGRAALARRALVHPDGQAPMTALCVSLAVEHLLGREGGRRPAPGLYMPQTLIEPAVAVAALREVGMTIEDVWRDPTVARPLPKAAAQP